MKYAAIDFETAYWGPGSACSLGISVSDGHEITDEWYRLIKPYRMNFDPACVQVNGIYPDDVENEPAFPAFWQEVAQRLEGSIVFAHNARFDMGVLASVLDVYDLPDIHFLYGDTVAVSRMLWKELPNHKLATVAGSLGYDFRHHQALDDARACEMIVRKAVEKTEAATVKETASEKVRGEENACTRKYGTHCTGIMVQESKIKTDMYEKNVPTSYC